MPVFAAVTQPLHHRCHQKQRAQAQYRQIDRTFLAEGYSVPHPYQEGASRWDYKQEEGAMGIW
jgi:hypothetical protein